MNTSTLRACLAGSLLAFASCITVDADTNRPIPRGNQRHEFEEVTRRAEDLQNGMSKRDVLLLLGSPAETSDQDDVWVYLPERPAVIVPGRALRLEFEDGRLVDHGYHAIVLGARF